MQHNIGFLLSNCPQELDFFYELHVEYYFDDFGIWLLKYRIELSCLYIPQRYPFISPLWLWSI